ncbi:hypothetical protein BDQ12DRAFT_672368 [Crucibulum laeve]|uniref:F-box domain-containing protein n=1 Tax=Crucibulum laeve TaxID=68775 RepID=A0A5C3MFT5_9AGAR|nr:hypothetical protein BDQ12DRAFT_672368 [Crucibulum laeve]
MHTSGPSSTFYLPQELVDHIIDHLHDDPVSLSHCSLVCHAWLRTSRLHLFAKVNLKAGSPHTPAVVPPEDRCRSLYRLLKRSPEIIPHIRELDICEGSPAHHSPEVRSTTWVTVEWSLPPLLKMLTHLKRLDFAATSTMHWKTLPPGFQEAICTLLARPSLTYIRLHHWSFPDLVSLAKPLSACRNLKALALSSTTVSDDSVPEAEDEIAATPEEQQPDYTAQRYCLEVLTLDYVYFGYLEYWLLSHRSTVDVTGLRELRVAHFPDPTVVEKLLLKIGGSLEHFHLKPGSWDVHAFDLGVNSGLRSIRLTLEEPEIAMDWVMTLLTSITNYNVLERIGLEFYMGLGKLEGWSALDALLVRPELSSLRQVEIGIFAPPSHADFIKVNEELGGIEGRGILRLYQLGIKSQRSSRQLTPRISHYES